MLEELVCDRADGIGDLSETQHTSGGPIPVLEQKLPATVNRWHDRVDARIAMAKPSVYDLSVDNGLDQWYLLDMENAFLYDAIDPWNTLLLTLSKAGAQASKRSRPPWRCFVSTTSSGTIMDRVLPTLKGYSLRAACNDKVHAHLPNALFPVFFFVRRQR
jgi:hypothetical protein